MPFSCFGYGFFAFSAVAKTDFDERRLLMVAMINRFRTAEFHKYANQFFLSAVGIALELLLACAIVYFRLEVEGVKYFLILIGMILILSSDLLTILPPTLFISVFVTDCYNSASTFLAFIIPYAVSILLLLALHIALYAKKPRLGMSFYGLIAVAVATSLSGLGVLELENIASPVSLYYIFFLGAGMLLLYILFQSVFSERKEYSVFDKLALTLYFMGILAALIIANYYLEFEGSLYEQFVIHRRLVLFQSKNNLSTFLLFALPFPFYFALTRSPLHVLSGLFMYIALVFSGSHGGLLMGTIIFALCLLYLIIYGKNFRSGWILVSLLIFLLLALSFYYILVLYGLNSVSEIFTKKVSRLDLLRRAWHDFRSAPIFGIGLTNPANTDIYKPVTGAMNWYHMMIPQIFAGMGIVGGLAWFFQLLTRLTIFIKKRDCYAGAIALSYLGLFLMSQVNPGEFCPIPYGFLAVLLFVFLEHRPDCKKKKDTTVPMTISTASNE